MANTAQRTKLFTPAIVAVCATSGTAWGQASYVITGDQTQLASWGTNDQGETSSAAIPPGANANCSATGKVIMSFGNGYWDYLMSASVGSATYSSIGNPSQPSLFTTVTNNPQTGVMTCNQILTPTRSLQRYSHGYTDNQTVRVKRNGVQPTIFHAELSECHYAPSAPVGMPAACNNDFITKCIVTSWTTNCGSTWNVGSTVLDVQSGWDGGLLNTPRDGLHAGDGFDRQAMYVDPFVLSSNSSRVFIASDWSAQPADKTMLIQSSDGGVTWGNPMFLNSAVFGGTPVAMTSVETGRLFVAKCLPDGTPIMHWLDAGSTVPSAYFGRKYIGGRTIYNCSAVDDVPPPIPGQRLYGGPNPGQFIRNAPYITVSRIHNSTACGARAPISLKHSESLAFLRRPIVACLCDSCHT